MGQGWLAVIGRPSANYSNQWLRTSKASAKKQWGYPIICSKHLLADPDEWEMGSMWTTEQHHDCANRGNETALNLRKGMRALRVVAMMLLVCVLGSCGWSLRGNGGAGVPCVDGCAPGLVCCYPCGANAEPCTTAVCMEPCDDDYCSGGCPMYQ